MLTLRRIAQSGMGTFGVILNGNIPICISCEDPWNDNKKGISCIPEGIYKVRRYSGTKYKNVFEITNVPNRSAILIHWGNTMKDTEGCILLGKFFGSIDGIPAVIESKLAFDKFSQIVPDTFDLKIVNCYA